MVSRFDQWRTSFQNKGEVARFTWVCGAERVLVEYVVEQSRRALRPEPWNYLAFSFGDGSERAIWEQVDQLPIGRGPRLVVLRQAERMTWTDRLVQLVEERARSRGVHLLFVSDDATVPMVDVPGEERQQIPAPHIRALDGKWGKVVVCAPFAQSLPGQGAAKAWVRDQVEMPEPTAGYLLNRAAGDLRVARDACLKLAAIGAEPTPRLIDRLIPQAPRDTYAGALLEFDRETALLALPAIERSQSSFRYVLGRIDSEVAVYGQVYDLLNANGQDYGRTFAAMGTRGFLLKDHHAFAKHYSPKRRFVMRERLMLADQAVRANHFDGVLEFLLATWAMP